MTDYLCDSVHDNFSSRTLPKIPKDAAKKPSRKSLQHFLVLWLAKAGVLCFEGSVARGFETSPCHRIVSVGKQLRPASYLYP